MRIFLTFLIISISSTPLLSLTKGTLDSLILTWDISREGCEKVSDGEEKSYFCIMMKDAAEALKAKGFCRGAHTLRIDVDSNKDNVKFRDQYKIFETIVRNKWIPCIYEIFLENKERSFIFNEEMEKDINWLTKNIDGSYEIDVNQIILRERLADLDCRGGTDPETVYRGCGVRKEIISIIEDHGLCIGEYNNPMGLEDIGGEYVWFFRNKWMPCLYTDLTSDYDFYVNPLTNIVMFDHLEEKGGLYYEKDTLFAFTGLVLDALGKTSGRFKDGKKNGIWRYFDSVGQVYKTEHYQNGLLVSESKKPMHDMLERAKILYPGRCEWNSNYGRYHSFKFGESDFYAVECLHGSYNAWYVYLEKTPDGQFIPITFTYPHTEYSFSESGSILNSKVIGMRTTDTLCNPVYDEEKLTINTFCKGRGIGDVGDYGLWQLIQEKNEDGINNEFILLKFEDDFTDDEKKNPITVFDVTEMN